MKTKRPKFRAGDRVSLASYTPLIPAYDNKPFVGRSTVLRVSSIVGKGTIRDPWHVSVTDDDGHFWKIEPDDLVFAESSAPAAIVASAPSFVEWEEHDDPDEDVPAGYEIDYSKTTMSGRGRYRAPVVRTR